MITSMTSPAPLELSTLHEGSSHEDLSQVIRTQLFTSPEDVQKVLGALDKYKKQIEVLQEEGNSSEVKKMVMGLRKGVTARFEESAREMAANIIPLSGVIATVLVVHAFWEKYNDLSSFDSDVEPREGEAVLSVKDVQDAAGKFSRATSKRLIYAQGKDTVPENISDEVLEMLRQVVREYIETLKNTLAAGVNILKDQDQESITESEAWVQSVLQDIGVDWQARRDIATDADYDRTKDEEGKADDAVKRIMHALFTDLRRAQNTQWLMFGNEPIFSGAEEQCAEAFGALLEHAERGITELAHDTQVTEDDMQRAKKVLRNVSLLEVAEVDGLEVTDLPNYDAAVKILNEAMLKMVEALDERLGETKLNAESIKAVWEHTLELAVTLREIKYEEIADAVEEACSVTFARKIHEQVSLAADTNLHGHAREEPRLRAMTMSQSVPDGQWNSVLSAFYNVPEDEIETSIIKKVFDEITSEVGLATKVSSLAMANPDIKMMKRTLGEGELRLDESFKLSLQKLHEKISDEDGRKMLALFVLKRMKLQDPKGGDRGQVTLDTMATRLAAQIKTQTCARGGGSESFDSKVAGIGENTKVTLAEIAAEMLEEWEQLQGLTAYEMGVRLAYDRDLLRLLKAGGFDNKAIKTIRWEIQGAINHYFFPKMNPEVHLSGLGGLGEEHAIFKYMNGKIAEFQNGNDWSAAIKAKLSGFSHEEATAEVKNLRVELKALQKDQVRTRRQRDRAADALAGVVARNRQLEAGQTGTNDILDRT